MLSRAHVRRRARGAHAVGRGHQASQRACCGLAETAVCNDLRAAWSSQITFERPCLQACASNIAATADGCLCGWVQILRWKLLGNAVSVPIGNWVGERLDDPLASKWYPGAGGKETPLVLDPETGVQVDI